ncbi:MAG: ABC transporter substrate-binding protein [Pleurocapsa minor GSE-CHR-MK-17-07R]|jgi:peptide/nickel transport system substrate-binding protein|nr:ABC transporter substrate-binding protein [Pleurocapsa minor GSE-CHR-MK 17-07R]
MTSRFRAHHPSTPNRILVVLSLILLFTISFSAVGAQDLPVLRVGMNAPVALDPALGSNDPEIALNRAIYDYLVNVKPDSSIAPALASAWDISEDGLTYTFTLREGVTFHDGSAFSSADVVFTFNRLVELGSPALNLLGSDFVVAAPDATTVTFTLSAPNADFLYGVGSRWAGVLKDGATAPNTIGEGDAAFASFNGTGAFVLTSFSPDDRAVFTTNTAWWGWSEQEAGLSGLEFIYFEDPVAQVDALLSGVVDHVFKIPSAQFSGLEGVEGIVPIQIATSQHPVIRLRADAGFAGENPLVREAFKFATDRAALNDILLEGRGVVGHNDPISPVYGAFYDATAEDQAYDPAQACALLTEAGYPDGISLTLFTPDSLGYPELATVLQQFWAEACINVTIEVRPESVYYSTVDQPEDWFNVELGISGYGARPIPQQFLVEAYASTGIYNEAHWVDEELDALIAQAGATADTAERAAIYSQISAIFRERGPIIIPWFAPMLGASSAAVQGLEMNPFPGLTDYTLVSLAG